MINNLKFYYRKLVKKRNNFKIWSIVTGFKNKNNEGLLQYEILTFKDK